MPSPGRALTTYRSTATSPSCGPGADGGWLGGRARQGRRQCRINLGLTPDGNDGNIVNTDALAYDYTFIKNSQGGYKLSGGSFEDLVNV
jgi:hypothetical protein